ncbi:hypothetical protein R3I94_016326 [Phoxinus phoxinus]
MQELVSVETVNAKTGKTKAALRKSKWFLHINHRFVSLLYIR